MELNGNLEEAEAGQSVWGHPGLQSELHGNQSS